MIILLFSILVMVIQGLLDMVDWWILFSNWALSGALSAVTASVLTGQHLMGYNRRGCIIWGWVLMSNVLNLSAIYLQPDMAWWRVDLLLIGFAVLLQLVSTFWQQTDEPGLCLLLGFLVILLGWLHVTALLWMLGVIILLIHLLSYSRYNFYALLSGLAMGTWMLYSLLFLLVSEEKGAAFIYNFIYGWESLSFGLPDHMGWWDFTRVSYPYVMMALYIFFVIVGRFQGSNSGLRERSLFGALSTVGIFLLLIMPVSWALYLDLGAILMLIHLLLTLGSSPSRAQVKGFRGLVIFGLVSSVAEPIAHLTMVYLNSIDFSPLYSWWPF